MPDPADPTKMLLPKGKQLVSFAALRDDGTTSCGCWIYSGCFNEAGNNMARRDNQRSRRCRHLPEMDVVLAGQPAHPLQSGFGDLTGKPWDPSRKLLEWNGNIWVGYDVPDIAPNAKPDVVGPFIMNAEGTARLFARTLMRDGPFPTHYEPFESAGCQRDQSKDQG